MKKVRIAGSVLSVGLVLTVGGFFHPLPQAAAQEKKDKLSSGWESEKALVRVGNDNVWSITYYAFPHMAYNLRGDGKWVLISNREVNDHYLGYYYDVGKAKWVEDKAIVSGLKSRGWREYPAFARNVTGDNKWTLISHQSSSFYGYYWDGKQWVEDASRVSGLPRVGGKTSHDFLENLTGDGKCTLLTGTGAGTFRAFSWNGKRWTEDPSRVKGLPDIGGDSRVTAGFNVYGDNKWNLITSIRTSKAFRVFSWNGRQWNEDAARAAGLTLGNYRRSEAVPTLGYNLKGDGKWVLISGIARNYTLLGFQYNSVDTSSLPAQKNVTSYHPLATTVRIKFAYPKTWNHRIRYSTRSDMSDASWSKWFEDVDDVDFKLEGLSPETTYYYQVYTYVPWNTSYYVTSPRKTFTTTAARKHILLKPGLSIQDAIETLPPEGGTIELARGVHDVRDTIVINRSNITIMGTHESEIRNHVRRGRIFAIPHDKGSPEEPWDTMPILENFTFKGFKVTSPHKGRSAGGLLCAWNVKNLIVEDILDESLRSLVSINPTGGYTKAHSENIFIRNNNCFQSEIGFCYSRNVHVIGNKIKRAAGDGIDINNHNQYVYIKNNRIFGGANYNIRGHSGRYIWIENNTLLGGTQIGIFMDGASHVTINNNTITGCSRAAIDIDPQPPLKIRIINNRIYNNPGHGIWTTKHRGHHDSVVDIINNVICNNGGSGIEMTVNWVQLKSITNNIITGNKGYGINYLKTFKPTIIKYNNIWNNKKGNYNRTSPGEGDISADPLFADPAKGDFHLKSQVGRWDPKTEKWVKDKVQSPCIDAGGPKADFKKEPVPNGGRVNVGAYGNTKEASKSAAQRG